MTDCVATYMYGTGGILEDVMTSCVLNDNGQNLIFVIEFAIMFYIFVKLMNYASGFVSRLTK